MKLIYMLIVLCSCCLAETTLDVKWQQVITCDTASYVPHLVKVDSDDQIHVIGSSFDVLNKDSVVKEVLWKYNSEGEQICSNVLKEDIAFQASNVLMPQNESIVQINGYIVFSTKSSNESRLYGYKADSCDKVQASEMYQSPAKNGRIEKIILEDGNLFIGGNSKDVPYLIKKNVAGKQLYRQEVSVCVTAVLTDIASMKGSIASCGCYLSSNNSKIEATIWVATHGKEGQILKAREFKVEHSQITSRPPQICLLTNGNIILAYNDSSSSDNSKMFIRLYDPDLELIKKTEIYESNQFSSFNLTRTNTGFVAVISAETYAPHFQIRQYDMNAKLIAGCEIKNATCYGSSKPIIDVKGNMLYLAHTDNTYTSAMQDKQQFKTILTAVGLE